MKTELKVEGMTCQNCVRHAREALLAINGVTGAEVTLDPAAAVIDHNGTVTLGELIAALSEEGYPATQA